MLEILGKQLAGANSADEKLSILADFPSVRSFFEGHPSFAVCLSPFSLEERVLFYQLAAIGQADRIGTCFEKEKIETEALRTLLKQLAPIDLFYRELGGIVGYQAKVLELLRKKKEPAFGQAAYHSPSFIHIEEETPAVQEAVRWGIDALARSAEIYPLGGAADRLHLVEEKTGAELPAAKLPFAGKTLFEHLIRDLQAREYLYFQLYGIQLSTPLAIMTSHEKNNHSHILEICEQFHYFGRPKNTIRLFPQPLVPAVDEEGNWCFSAPLTPLLKPGGHGTIWKLARDEGIFDWLEGFGRTKGLVRQINNPIAGLDYGLLAFLGFGDKNQMLFGFASCPRLLEAAEGVNVLVEKGSQIVLTNIEYCDFTKFGIEDRPLKEGEPYSRFSSNTNILFADLKAISSAVEKDPFPGLLLNLKKGTYRIGSGEKKEGMIARLESTMQNIADVFVEEKKEALKTERTFVTYHRRHKTISTAKKGFIPGKSLQETPENCFYDLLSAHRELLSECGFELPSRRTLPQFLEEGPEFLFLYHPALGPLYSAIRKKLIGGKLSIGSELILEISSFFGKNLQIDGSLQIVAEQPMGHIDREGILHFSNRIGRCTLENVTIENQGVNWTESSPFWKMDLKRRESVVILLKGESSFTARNIHLQGSHTFIVENGQSLIL